MAARVLGLMDAGLAKPRPDRLHRPARPNARRPPRQPRARRGAPPRHRRRAPRARRSIGDFQPWFAPDLRLDRRGKSVVSRWARPQAGTPHVRHQAPRRLRSLDPWTDDMGARSRNSHRGHGCPAAAPARRAWRESVGEGGGRLPGGASAAISQPWLLLACAWIGVGKCGFSLDTPTAITARLNGKAHREGDHAQLHDARRARRWRARDAPCWRRRRSVIGDRAELGDERSVARVGVPAHKGPPADQPFAADVSELYAPVRIDDPPSPPCRQPARPRTARAEPQPDGHGIGPARRPRPRAPRGQRRCVEARVHLDSHGIGPSSTASTASTAR